MQVGMGGEAGADSVICSQLDCDCVRSCGTADEWGFEGKNCSSRLGCEAGTVLAPCACLGNEASGLPPCVVASTCSSATSFAGEEYTLPDAEPDDASAAASASTACRLGEKKWVMGC
jgi:hypothetical protein